MSKGLFGLAAFRTLCAIAFGVVAFSPVAMATTIGGNEKGVVNKTDTQITQSPEIESLLEQAVQQYEKGEFKAAIASFSEIIRRDPKAAEPYVFRAMVYLQQKDFKTADRDFTSAIGLSPELAYAYYGRAIARIQQEDEKGGVADFQKAGDLFKKQGNNEMYEEVANILKQIQG